MFRITRRSGAEPTGEATHKHGRLLRRSRTALGDDGRTCPRRSSVVLVLGIVLVSIAPACSHVESSVLRVGALYPTEGAQGVGGNEEEQGVRLAVEWVNAHGGVQGRRVQLVPVDTPRPEAVPAALDQLRHEGVGIVLGSHGSAISAVAARLAAGRQMVFFETGAVGEVPPGTALGRNFFRLAPMGANLGRAAISFVHDQLLPRLKAGSSLRYAVAYVDDPYGRAVGLGAMAEIRKRRLPMATAFAYNAHTANFNALARRIAAARTDVLFVSAYIDDGVALRKALVAEHVRLVSSIGTSSSYCHPAFGERLGRAAVGLFASDKPDADNVRADALTPEGRRSLDWVRARYTADYHKTMSAPALSGFSNAYAVLVHILPAASSSNVTDVAAAAVKVKLPEGSLSNGGGLDLAPVGQLDAGENRAAAGVIWQWVAPRTRAVVWPPAFATHPIVAIEPQA